MMNIEKIFFCNLKLVYDEGNDLGGMSSFMKEAIMLIPQDEVLMMFFSKLEKSNAFSSFFEKLNEEDFDKICESFQVSIEIEYLVRIPLRKINFFVLIDSAQKMFKLFTTSFT